MTTPLSQMTPTQADQGDWCHILDVLKEAQEKLDSAGVRRSRIDGAINIAKEHAKDARNLSTTTVEIDQSGHPYGRVRVPTMYSGLVPISEFNAVEIHKMASAIDGDDLMPIEDVEPGSSVIAFSVCLHFRRGGIDTVQDFHFDPTEPGARTVAERDAEELALSLSDMILMSDPSLEPKYVLHYLANDPRAMTKEPSGPQPPSVSQFYEELLNNVETIYGISEEHGVDTLVDLFYLPHVIELRRSGDESAFIEQSPNSKIDEVLKLLPSAAYWESLVSQELLLDNKP